MAKKIDWLGFESRLRDILRDTRNPAETIVRVDMALAAYTRRGNAVSYPALLPETRVEEIEAEEWEG